MMDHHNQCCKWKVKWLYSHVNNGTWYILMGNLCDGDVTMLPSGLRRLKNLILIIQQIL